MRTTIDKAGRVVIPRALRSRIGMLGAGDVDIELDGAAIRIQPVAGEELLEKNGFLMVPSIGNRITNEMVRELIDEDRHRR